MNNEVFSDSIIEFNSHFFKFVNVSTIKASIVNDFTNIPNATKFVAGIINFEGEIIPLVNLTNININNNKNIKIVVLNSQNGIFAVPGTLINNVSTKNKIIEIDYTNYFSNEK